MQIKKRLDELVKKNDEINNEIDKLQKQINELVVEQYRLQGENRLLIQIGKEQGLISENGEWMGSEED